MPTEPQNTFNYQSKLKTGNKRYELTNHLGNVLAVISDRKIPKSYNVNSTLADYYDPVVLSASDYYPFGMEMPGRTMASNGYRYGFNGKEKDTEGEWGTQTHYDYGFRIYEPGIGRFLSVDPLMVDYAYYSPYQYAGNKPIVFIDLDGLEEVIRKLGTGNLILAVDQADIDAMLTSKGQNWDIIKVKNIKEIEIAVNEYSKEFGKLQNFAYHDHGAGGTDVPSFQHAVLFNKNGSENFSAISWTRYKEGLRSHREAGGSMKDYERGLIAMKEGGNQWKSIIATQYGLDAIFSSVKDGGNVFFTGCLLGQEKDLGQALSEFSGSKKNIYLNADLTASSRNGGLVFFDGTLTYGADYLYGFFVNKAESGDRKQIGGSIIFNSTGKKAFSIFAGYTKYETTTTTKGSKIIGTDTKVTNIVKNVKPKK